ncbi:hypothetical protein M9Y10_043894 [Tritrichomonas musculus]|uniref:Uncharacterized protein n=1 Tax=Tritrichomonas musculus TaxID=1915356 RepID=A0ABR2K0Z7_9EUKA
MMFYKNEENDDASRKDFQDEDANSQNIANRFEDFYHSMMQFYKNILESGKMLSEELIKQSTFFLNQLKIFVQHGFDIATINFDLLRFIFSIPTEVINNRFSDLEDNNELDPSKANLDSNGISYIDLRNFIYEFVVFIEVFSDKSSDEICFKLFSTNYINAITIILNNVKNYTIILTAIKCFINLLDKKPMLGQLISYHLYGDLYKLYNYKIENIMAKNKRIIYFDHSNPNYSTEYQYVLFRCAAIEAFCNFEVFLPNLYKQVQEENRDRGPKQLFDSLKLLIDINNDQNDIIKQYQTDFFFKMVEKIFRYADPMITKFYFTDKFINIIIQLIGPNFDFKYDKQIIFCLSKIAESGATPARLILTPQFLQYQPYVLHSQKGNYINKQLIILYCNLWCTIISSLGGPSNIAYARIAGIKFLKEHSNSIIEMTKIIISQQKNDCEFEMIKATSLIHVALININDNELTSRILENFPDTLYHIQQLIEEEDPKAIIPIIKATEILLIFFEKQGKEKYPQIIEWIQNGILVESLKNAQTSLYEYANICLEIQRVLKMFDSFFVTPEMP